MHATASRPGIGAMMSDANALEVASVAESSRNVQRGVGSTRQ
jgi:hypothetical protein